MQQLHTDIGTTGAEYNCLSQTALKHNAFTIAKIQEIEAQTGQAADMQHFRLPQLSTGACQILISLQFQEVHITCAQSLSALCSK